MDENLKNTLLTAASLLTKAASSLEYGRNLEKEASATTDDIISHGMASADQREFYKDYLAKNPDKIASIKSVINDLPVPANKGLGEATIVSNEGQNALDAFDLMVLS